MTASSDKPNQLSRIVSVSVGGPRAVNHHGRTDQTAIWKSPVSGRVAVRGVNIEGDDQADRVAHGGPDKAIYAYALEDYRWWASELGSTIEPAAFGENLTTEGIDVSEAVIGERWRFEGLLLEVSEPRLPCWKLNVRMGDNRFIQKFAASRRPGTYLRIIEEGDVGGGDAFTAEAKPAHGLTIGDLSSIFHRHHDQAERLLGIDQLSAAWQTWARQTIDRSQS